METKESSCKLSALNTHSTSYPASSSYKWDAKLERNDSDMNHKGSHRTLKKYGPQTNVCAGHDSTEGRSKGEEPHSNKAEDQDVKTYGFK